MKTFLILLGLVAVCSALTCPPGSCDGHTCEDVKAEDCDPKLGEYQENAGFCGCCPVCVTYIEENESCRHLFLLGVPTADTMCRPNLECNRETGLCQSPNFDEDVIQVPLDGTLPEFPTDFNSMMMDQPDEEEVP